jgi:hypothetical protein
MVLFARLAELAVRLFVFEARRAVFPVFRVLRFCAWLAELAVGHFVFEARRAVFPVFRVLRFRARLAELAVGSFVFEARRAVFPVFRVLRFCTRLTRPIVLLDTIVVVHGCCSLRATTVSGWNKQYGEESKRTDHRQREKWLAEAARQGAPWLSARGTGW